PCRSPMAEILLWTKIKRNKIRWWDAASCGIHAEVGGTISENSKTALEEAGMSVEKFSPRQLTQKLIENSTLVICMTETQKKVLENCGNVCCIKDLCGYDVPDPYGCNLDAYRVTRDALSRACDIIIKNYIKTYKEEEQQ
ncbi:MAG: hypothetical protein K2N30_05495, partial [Clostridia bacterium]|nr:hypothetical protein [Clostridia bacterium]